MSLNECREDAIVKMIDTYISQLREIREDVLVLSKSKEPSKTELTDQEIVDAIMLMFSRKDEAGANDILNEIILRLHLKGVKFTQKDIGEVKELNYNDIKFNTISKFLISQKVEYTVSKEKMDEYSTSEYKTITIKSRADKPIIKIYFDNIDRLYKINISRWAINYS